MKAALEEQGFRVTSAITHKYTNTWLGHRIKPFDMIIYDTEDTPPRDASFFRENHLRYSDAMGDAIRKSPSVRVDLNVESIDVVDATHARVTVQRTDEFDGGAPAAKQRLVFVLERQNGAWRIARFERG